MQREDHSKVSKPSLPSKDKVEHNLVCEQIKMYLQEGNCLVISVRKKMDDSLRHIHSEFQNRYTIALLYGGRFIACLLYTSRCV